ncbi:hypothetical protein [Streptomyces sp. NRRL F-2664]|uniref:hypothetical protein n=1 Tax=Streptomyces sp. NRRL F-2664 TaxID=1463842 RepID=UPI00068BAD6A|nr:hypothetical protein [Streptomyces sp. NRRL F-2664]
MAHVRTGLHISIVTLGSAQRVCAIWSVRGTAAEEHACEFPGALLLPRKGAEQDWAVETALAAVLEQCPADGPVCVNLTTTAGGIEAEGLRTGLCASDLLNLARTALGEDQREWAELARADPAAFHATAAQPYTLRQQAACLITRGPNGPHKDVTLLHARQDTVLRDYTVGLLASAGATDATETARPSHPRRP